METPVVAWAARPAAATVAASDRGCSGRDANTRTGTMLRRQGGLRADPSTEDCRQEHGSMVTELPVRIEFALPDGWQAAPPDEVGAPEVAFVAVRPVSPGGFVTNLTIAGEIRDPAVRMATIADESVHRVENVAESVRVRDRADLGQGDAPGLTQLLDIELAEGKRLVQCQVYLPIDDAHDQHTVLELVLTCTPEQFDDVASDFQRFVGTVRPTPARS
ncbi:hypothetical protein ACIA5G_25305 [Amycolatopsis sp. NPDC051758]|uniref:hypothetical protein n=1 Tax=Amycolatopsis sp. NPDC051758 TaxID=3363935 RepID=UPI0037AB7E9D